MLPTVALLYHIQLLKMVGAAKLRDKNTNYEGQKHQLRGTYENGGIGENLGIGENPGQQHQLRGRTTPTKRDKNTN